MDKRFADSVALALTERLIESEAVKRIIPYEGSPEENARELATFIAKLSAHLAEEINPSDFAFLLKR